MDRIPGVATVAAAQEGDQQAQDALVTGYLPLVYNVVGRALHGHADVDDVVQETVIRMLEGLGGLRDPGSFRSWLLAVAMNQVRTHWRENQRAAQGDGPHDPVEVADPTADFVDVTIMRLGLSGQRRETAEATRWLDENDRGLLSLWWLEAAGELSRTEVAEALELSAQHTAVRVQRMKAQLETARVVIRALSADPRCGELEALAERWDGVPSALWRKRIARHARGCVACSGLARDLVPAEGLLVGLGLVPLAAGLAAALASAGGHGTAVVNTAAHLRTAGSGAGQATHGTTAHGATGHGATGLRKFSGWRAPATVATATAVFFALLSPGGGGRPKESSPGARPEPSASPTTSSATPRPHPSPSQPPRPSATPSPKPTAGPSRTPAPHPPPQTTAPAPTSVSNATPSATPDPAHAVLSQINQARAANDLPPYTLTSGLAQSAEKHSEAMSNGCGLSHQCPGEAPFGDRESAEGVQWTAAGENIGEASSGPSSQQITSAAVGLTRGMLNEQPPNDYHRQNLLSGSFHHIGIGFYRDEGGTLWMTQDFSD